MSAYVVFTRIKTLDRKELEAYWVLIKETMVGHPIEVLVPYGNRQKVAIYEGILVEDTAANNQ